jgi:hypothetical protein
MTVVTNVSKKPSFEYSLRSLAIIKSKVNRNFATLHHFFECFLENIDHSRKIAESTVLGVLFFYTFYFGFIVNSYKKIKVTIQLPKTQSPHT